MCHCARDALCARGTSEVNLATARSLPLPTRVKEPPLLHQHYNRDLFTLDLWTVSNTHAGDVWCAKHSSCMSVALPLLLPHTLSLPPHWQTASPDKTSLSLMSRQWCGWMNEWMDECISAQQKVTCVSSSTNWKTVGFPNEIWCQYWITQY